MPPTSTRRRPEGDDSSVAIGVQPDRISRLEAAVASIQHTLDVQFKRMAEMQAELDQLTAKTRNSGDQ